MRWLHSVFLISAVGTTSNYFHFSAFSDCIAEAHEELNFIPFFFHAMATIQKSRTRSTVLFYYLAQFFPRWKLLFAAKTTAAQQSIYSPQYDWRRRSMEEIWNICEYRNCDLTFPDGFIVFQLNNT